MLRTHGEYKEAEALCAKVLERKIKTEAEPSSIARTQRQLGGILDDLGTQLTCFTGTKVQILTQRQLSGILDDLGTQLTCFTGTKVQNTDAEGAARQLRKRCQMLPRRY